MNYSRTSERGTSKATRSLLIALLVALISLFAVGCGSSSSDYVVTGNDNTPPPPPAQTGSVTFQLAKAQAATVPQSTESLVFEFFDGNSIRVFGPLARAFAGTITIEGVPTSATLARITALDASGNPLSISTAIFNVVPGGNVQATIGVPTPTTFSVSASPDPTRIAVNATQQLGVSVTFSDGTIILPPVPASSVIGGTLAFTSDNPGIAAVTATGGLVTGVAPGNTTVRVSFTLNGTVRQDTVSVQVTGGGVTPPPVDQARLEVDPTSVTLTNATTSQTIEATYFPANSVLGEIVTADTTATGTTASITYDAGTITSTAVEDATANLIVSYTPEGGSAVNATVAVTVSRVSTPPVGTARLEVSPDTLILEAGQESGVLRPVFFASDSAEPRLLNPNEFTVTFSNQNPPGDRFSSGTTPGTIEATGPDGDPSLGTTVTATVTAIIGGDTVSDTIAVTVGTAAEANSVASARILSLVGTSLKLPTSSHYPIVIEETLENGEFQTVASVDMVAAGATSGQYTVASSGPAVSYTAGGLLDFDAAGSATVTITRDNSVPAGGAAVTFNITATVDNGLVATGNKIVLDREPTSGVVGSVIPYAVTLDYATGADQDLTPLFAMTTSNANLTVSSVGGQPAAGFNLGGVAIAAVGGGTLRITGPAVVTTAGFDIGGVDEDTETEFTAVTIGGTAAP